MTPYQEYQLEKKLARDESYAMNDFIDETSEDDMLRFLGQISSENFNHLFVIFESKSNLPRIAAIKYLRNMHYRSHHQELLLWDAIYYARLFDKFFHL